MPRCFDPFWDILPAGQKEIWQRLGPAPDLGLVLYGGTAIALQLGHRQSVDFDFFCAEPLDKESIRAAFGFMPGAKILQDSINTLVVSADMPSDPVKVSFFGGLSMGRVNDPIQTRDGTLIVASLEDLLATKLKVILDRAEAKDYRDIAALLGHGVSLPLGLAAFQQMFDGEPSEVLRAMGYFEDGDLRAVGEGDRQTLRAARDKVRELPSIVLVRGSLSIPIGACDDGAPAP